MQENKMQENKTHLTQTNLRQLMHKMFRRDNLIVMVLVGILLFIIALPTGESGTSIPEGEEVGGQEAQGDKVQDGMEMTGAESGEMSDTYEDYAALQEEKLKNILTSMEGVGRVEVMLTFLSSEELVVEKDEPTSRSNTVEQDSEGGSRTVTQYEKGDSTVYHSASGDGEPYVVKTLNPRVEGVLVVAEGAGDGTVNRSIAEIAQALFGVEAHKVIVVPMDALGSSNGMGD